jgi:hypothetical protein
MSRQRKHQQPCKQGAASEDPPRGRRAQPRQGQPAHGLPSGRPALAAASSRSSSDITPPSSSSPRAASQHGVWRQCATAPPSTPSAARPIRASVPVSSRPTGAQVLDPPRPFQWRQGLLTRKLRGSATLAPPPESRYPSP